MGDPNGFLKYKKKTASYRPVSERILDYKEVEKKLSNSEIRKQAARCMDCGIPFCHAVGCPTQNLIPEFNDFVYKGHWKEAFQRLESANPLPEITGRICPATCETSCTLSINDAPVSIRQIELAIIEHAYKKGYIKSGPPKKNTGKKIAVIGSGPAGLAAAIRLRQLGHKVIVMEKSNSLGGILRYGIPDFKLEKWVLDRRIDLMRKDGVKFKTSIDIGNKIEASELLRQYDAILLVVGAGEPRDLDLPGRDLKYIYFAMDYLTDSNKYVSGQLNRAYMINAKNKDVLVIGGGDTGSDCVGTANRQGAKNVTQIEIMPKPEVWTKDWNPEWPNWPMILRQSSSHKEGVRRDWSILTKEFIGKQGRVNSVNCIKVKWEKNNEGKYLMKEIFGSNFSIKANLILLAMGFIHTEHSKLIKNLKVDFDPKGNIATDNYQTSKNKIFAAGDSDIGASSAVRAIFHGQKVSVAINDFLTGSSE